MLLPHGEVMGCDLGSPREAAGLTEAGVEVELASDGLDLVSRAATVVKSPGVPAHAPAVAAAHARGIEVVGELEIAWRLIEAEFVAVSGTNGKTTTVELLGAVHRAAGVPVVVAGNVGTALAELPGTAAEVVVCEASSFQLEDASAFAPEAAALLNVSEDHIDRHGTFAAYRDAKLRVFARQLPEDVAVVPGGLEPPGGQARVVRFARQAAADLALVDGILLFEGAALMPADEVRLRGAHNLDNAMAAAALALARGIDADAVREALRGFAGVAHRLEEVARRRGVLYVNDSKATNPDSARVGVEAFPGGVHLILGGSLKGGDFRALRDVVRTRCRAVYLIGEAEGRLASDLEGTVTLHRCGTLERAFEAAAGAAQSGQVVLLSPACASFDAFRDYEHRGERFRELAEELAEDPDGA
ncbi:MAG: UDP-N-acetylmuramoyl-L-alanine--D-glutamate ligase [Actinomycetota bacterium]|nr:UDP-N-acetylmuramoyl-L-alanine--D-glutamate ligase [Actinomycetota bacterium]